VNILKCVEISNHLSILVEYKMLVLIHFGV
jgi:hypothetical protein